MHNMINSGTTKHHKYFKMIFHKKIYSIYCFPGWVSDILFVPVWGNVICGIFVFNKLIAATAFSHAAKYGK